MLFSNQFIVQLRPRLEFKYVLSQPQGSDQDFLPKIKDAINNLTHKPVAANSLSDSLNCFPLEKLSYSDWPSFLHLLAYRQRSDLMQDLITLYPAIIHLGGEEAMRGVVYAMKDVCSHWK